MLYGFTDSTDNKIEIGEKTHIQYFKKRKIDTGLLAISLRKVPISNGMAVFFESFQNQRVPKTSKGDPYGSPFSGRGGEIRTHDPLYPKQVRYQTAPRPDRLVL